MFALAPGRGALDVERVAGASAVVGARASAPLKLLVPRPRGASVWAYAATFGGGLLPGDSVELELSLGTGASAMLATQASTKVYPSDGRPAVQALHARVADGALLALLPDPVCPFAGAVYRQSQRIDLAPGASLVLVDGLVSGRAARGERYRFTSYRSRTDVYVDGHLAVRDALLLEDTEAFSIADRMGRFDALASVLLLGPAFADAAAVLLAHIAAQPARPAGAPRASLHAAASPVAGGSLVRIAGEHAADVAAMICRSLEALPALLGDDPWARRW